jgi:hypothetical protein
MKRTKVTSVEIPLNSEILNKRALASYVDAYQITIDYKERSALQLWIAHIIDTPQWINILMTTRNKMVSLVGLKNLGELGAIDHEKPIGEYCVGDRMGIFTLSFISETEVMLTIVDKHLDVHISLHKNNQVNGGVGAITISCVVEVHNNLGKSYMFFIKPLHRFIVPHRLARLS